VRIEENETVVGLLLYQIVSVLVMVHVAAMEVLLSRRGEVGVVVGLVTSALVGTVVLTEEVLTMVVEFVIVFLFAPGPVLEILV
jgi:hypothetical protein